MKKYMITFIDPDMGQMVLFRDSMDEITDAYIIGKKELEWKNIQIYAKLEGDEHYTFVYV